MLEDDDIEAIVEALEHDSSLLDISKEAIREQASAALFELYKVPTIAAIQGTALWLSQHDTHIITAIGFIAVFYAVKEVYRWIFSHFLSEQV